MSRLLFTSALVLAVAVAGCAKGRGVVLVHVNDSNASRPISGIDHLIVTLTSGGNKMGGPYTVTFPSKPVTLPPEQTFSLSFQSSVTDALTINIQAIGADATTLASGSTGVAVKPSHVTEATVALTAGAVLPGLVALRAGGLGTMAAHPGTSTLKLLDDGFEFGDRACAGVLCVTGGLTP